MRNFTEWIKNLRCWINGYGYYVDFNKVYENVDRLKVELNIMNTLIGSRNIETDFLYLMKKYPEILKCIPLLLAVRQNEIYVQDDEQAFAFDFERMNCSIEQYISFMKKTGLMDLIAHRIVNNLVDYALGVETGLDSNGRKNRGGHQMEDLVEKYIRKIDVEYYREMYITEIEAKWGIDLSAVSAEGTATKRWDFVVKTAKTVYVIETNFYSSGGSKLNETARSYKMIAEEMRNVHGAEFIWITDGAGWNSARRNLKETFYAMKHLYNIKDLENGILTELFLQEKKNVVIA